MQKKQITKKVLLIAYNFPPLITPQSLRWFYLSRELSRKGFIVDVLTIKFPETAKDLLDELTDNIKQYRTFPGPFYYLTFKYSRENVTSEKENSLKSPSVFWKIISKVFWKIISKVYYKTFDILNALPIPDIYSEWLPFANRIGLNLINKNRYDVIISSSEPRVCHLVGYFIKKKSGIPWIADYGDPWIYPIPTFREPNLKKKIIERIEKKILRELDAITVASEGIKKLYIERYPFLPEHRIHVVTQGFDPDMFSRVKEEKPNKFRIVYCGSFYKNLRDPRAFFDAIKEIDNKDIEVIVVGIINEFADILRKEFNNVIKYYGFVSHKESLSLQRSATVLLHIGNNTDVQIPGKIYEYIGAKKPILCIRGDNKDLSEDLIIKYNKGIVVNNSKEEIKGGILRFYELWRKGLLTSTFNLNDIEEFTWRKKAEEICNIIKAL